jgi:hypothetical protein
LWRPWLTEGGRGDAGRLHGLVRDAGLEDGSRFVLGTVGKVAEVEKRRLVKIYNPRKHH